MNQFQDPISPNVPKRSGMPPCPTEAVRVSAHKEGVKNDLGNYQGTQKTPSFGKLGIKGDGEQK